MTPFQTIELQRPHTAVVTLWLNRPDKNNAFNAQMISELLVALEQIEQDPTVRVLVLRGRGRHFSAGADLAWMQACAELDYQANLADARQLSELMQRLYHMPMPTLAVVQGAVFGGAVGLVSCCDLAIGSGDAQFSLSEVRIGLAPAVISPYVVQAIGERAARRYALTAERFDGARAHALGLLSETYATGALENAMREWVDNLLLNSPHAMRTTKALLQEVGSGELSDALRHKTEETIALIRISPEGQAGLRAFLDKRKPAWQE